MNRKAVVFGGAGFIGSNLAHALVADGMDVTIFDAMASGSGAHPQNIKGLAAGFVQADVRDSKAVKNAVKGAAEVYNLAGQTGHLDSMQRPQNDLEANALGALNILEACRVNAPRARIVYCSTRQVYGIPDANPVPEDAPLRPPDINAVHKIAAESYHRLYSSVHGLSTCILRLSNVYGPRMRIADARQTFIGVWMRHVLEGSAFEVWGGSQRRDLVHVDDAVSALQMAMRHEQAVGRTFNVAGNDAIKLLDLARAMTVRGDAGFIGKKMPANRASIDVGDVLCDTNAIRETLGWLPKVSLDAGIRDTLDYYRTNLQTYLEDAV